MESSGSKIHDMFDQDAVRSLGWQFADACNLRDSEAFRQLWIPDGIWTIGEPLPFVGKGVDAIVSAFDGLLAQWEYFIQLPHAPVVQIDGDEAESRWTVAEEARSPDCETGYSNMGYYQDRIVRTPTGWKYAARTYTYLYLDTTPQSGNAYPRPPLRSLIS
ncbi:MAG: hypothetical protein C4320_00075 [Armatimonadota bacterium]